MLLLLLMRMMLAMDTPGVAAQELLGGARGPGSRTAALLTVLAWVCVCQLAGAWRTIRSDA